MPNHNASLTIYQLVVANLPFLTNDPSNEAICSIYTLQIMHDLESCFKVRFNSMGVEDWSRVGDEQYYTIIQKSIIADLVSLYVLTMIVAMGTLGTSTTTGTGTPPSTYLKRAKAGTTEVEYGQFSINDSAFSTVKVDKLMDLFRGRAINKAGKYGCAIEICDDCSVSVLMNTPPPPFIVIKDCNCGC